MKNSLKYVFTSGTFRLCLIVGAIGFLAGGVNNMVIAITAILGFQFLLGLLGGFVNNAKELTDFIHSFSKDMRLYAPMKFVNWLSKIAMFVANRYFKNHPDPLVRGDLEKVAYQKYPPYLEEYKWMYMDNPEAVVCSNTAYGRTFNGEHIYDAMAPGFMNEKLIRDSLTRAAAIGLLCFIFMTLVWHPRIYFSSGTPNVAPYNSFMPDSILSAFGVATESPAMQPEPVTEAAPHKITAWELQKLLDTNIEGDFWSLGDLEKKVNPESGVMDSIFAYFSNSVEQGKRSIVWLLGNDGNITALVFSLLVFWASFRGSVFSAVRNSSSYLDNNERQTIHGWLTNHATTKLMLTARTKQLEFIQKIDQTPVVYLGTATSVLHQRGVPMVAPEGQLVGQSLMDLQTNLLITGPVGSGKTLFVFGPLIKQLIGLRKENRELISIYCTDNKASLFKKIVEAVRTVDGIDAIGEAAEAAALKNGHSVEEAKKIREATEKDAMAKGQSAQIRIIGCKEGQYGVDLLNDLTPSEVRDILNSVCRQMSNSSNDDPFWTGMRDKVNLLATRIAFAHQFTPEGVKQEEETGERVYSLVNIYNLSQNDELIAIAIEDIVRSLKDDETLKIMRAAEAVDQVFFDSIDYFINQWMKMAEETKTGISANIAAAFGQFSENTYLRKHFSGGMPERVITVPEFWTKLVSVDMSSDVYGQEGRLINIFLKSLVFREARRRLKMTPELCRKQKMFMLMDEYQAMITSGGTNDDSNFWNESREAGICGIIGTQGDSSLEKVIGKPNLDNLLCCFNSSMVMYVEDPATLKRVEELSGKIARYNPRSRWDYQGYEDMNYQLRKPDVTLTSDYGATIKDAGKFSLTDAWNTDLLPSWNENKYEFDPGRYVHRNLFAPAGSHSDSSSIYINAATRNEDQNHQRLTTGIEERSVVEINDLKNMGNRCAYYSYVRGGVRYQAIINFLNP